MISGHRYLLDANIVSDLMVNPHGMAARRIIQVGEGTVCTSIIVACELRYGARKKNSARLLDRMEQALATLPVLALGAGVDTYYGEIRVGLERRGKPIGRHDFLIAAHALALNLILVTANIREFSRVPDLKVENWLA